ncbi:MAG: hypothetical protein E4G90_07220, partial [Gemmatimonadales bacterium]
MVDPLQGLTIQDIIDEYAMNPDADYNSAWAQLMNHPDFSDGGREAEWLLKNARSIFLGNGPIDPPAIETPPVETPPGPGVRPPLGQPPGIGPPEVPPDAFPPRIPFNPGLPPQLEDLFGQTGEGALFGDYVNQNFGGSGAYSDFFSTPAMMDKMRAASLLNYIVNPGDMMGGLANFLNQGGFPTSPTNISTTPGMGMLNNAA